MVYLITAIGSLSAAAVISSLRNMSRARIIGANSYPCEWTATSPMVDIFYELPLAKDKDYVSRLLEICKSEKVTYLAPLTDLEVDVLSVHREVFFSVGTILCIPSHRVVSVCRDKRLVYEIFKDDVQVKTIQTWTLDELPDSFAFFPVIAKPRTGRSSEGIVRIHNKTDFCYFKQKLSGADYVVQPQLNGPICVVDVVRQRATGRCATMCRQELIRTSNGAGLTVKMLRTCNMNDIAQHIVESLDINGCINIEFLVHEGNPLLMDVNPRFSAGVAFSKLSGYDMIANHFRCFSGLAIEGPVDPVPCIHARHYVEVTTALL